jgi:uncharacterized protein
MPVRLALISLLCLSAPLLASRPVWDAQDRAAFVSWFVLLTDAQFYRPTPDVTDCAGLVRHAAREALRDHTPEWLRQMALPALPMLPDVRARVVAEDGRLPIFRVDDDGPGSPGAYAEFADARTILRLNARHLGRDAHAARPGDLLAFHQPGQAFPEHLMVFVGRSHFERDHPDWVVYHTGPDAGGNAPGEMRKVRLADLRRHPAARWRPDPSNPHFLGVYRLVIP